MPVQNIHGLMPDARYLRGRPREEQVRRERRHEDAARESRVATQADEGRQASEEEEIGAEEESDADSEVYAPSRRPRMMEKGKEKIFGFDQADDGPVSTGFESKRLKEGGSSKCTRKYEKRSVAPERRKAETFQRRRMRSSALPPYDPHSASTKHDHENEFVKPRTPGLWKLMTSTLR